MGLTAPKWYIRKSPPSEELMFVNGSFLRPASSDIHTYIYIYIWYMYEYIHIYRIPQRNELHSHWFLSKDLRVQIWYTLCRSIFFRQKWGRRVFLCFIVVRYQSILPILFRVISLALGPYYDLLDASEANLTNMADLITRSYNIISSTPTTSHVCQHASPSLVQVMTCRLFDTNPLSGNGGHIVSASML